MRSNNTFKHPPLPLHSIQIALTHTHTNTHTRFDIHAHPGARLDSNTCVDGCKRSRHCASVCVCLCMCECSCVWQFAHCAEYLVVLIYLRGPNLYKVLSSEATMMATTMTTTTTTTTTLAIATPQRLSHVCGKKYD